MPSRLSRSLSFLTYSVIFVFYLTVGTIAAHPFDDSIYAQHAQYFYYLSINPSYSLLMGLYYDIINVAGYFVTIALSLGGMSNVLTIQLGVKVPFIVFTFITAYFLSKIVEDMGYSGKYASLLLLTSPIYFFTSVIYGSAIVVSMFFLVFSIHKLFRGSTIISAAFFGMAAGSYLYPIFSIPFTIRYVHRERGKRDAMIYLIVSSVFAAIGQITVLYFYSINGYLLAPNAPSSYLSIMPVPYYSIFDILNITGGSAAIPGVLYNYFYYGAAIIASLSYFLLKNERVNRETLLIFLLIQGVLFSAINPYNLPSYMAAAIPFAIVLTVVYRKWVLMALISIASLLSFIVMQTINSIGFLVYFSDVNMKLLQIRNAYPGWLNSSAGFLYSLSLLLLIPSALMIRRGRIIHLTKAIAAQFAVVAALFIVALLVLVPVVSNIPGGMFLSDQMNQFDAQPVTDFISGNSLVVEYSIPTVGFVGGSYLSDFVGYIKPSTTFITPIDSPRNVLAPSGNFVEHAVLPYPLQDARLQLFGNSNGSVNVELVNGSSTLIPVSHAFSTNNHTYTFFFDSILSGTYTLSIGSTVPLYGQNGSSPSIVFGGFLEPGKPVMGNHVLNGNYIPGYLLKSDITIEYGGPFKELPPTTPPVIVYLAKNLVDPVPSMVILGGFLFISLIVLPPLPVAFYSRRLR